MMTQLNGSILDTFPHKVFNHIEDLIDFDGPLLVHYSNQVDQDYLLHWVDNDDDANRWLIYRVSKQSLLNYLRGQEEFKALLDTTSSDFILVVDINSVGEYILMQLVSLEDLPGDYKPKEDVYYEFSLPDYYSSWTNESIANLTDRQKTRYQTLKEKAFYTNLRPSDREHGTSPKVPQMVDYLSKIDISWNGYAQVNYEKRFANNYSSDRELSKQLLLIKKHAGLRGVDFGPGSFGVALAPDLIDSTDEISQDVTNWLKTLPALFQEEVIDMDFDNPESMSMLSEKYTPEQLSRFLNPFLQIVENKSYQIARADKDFKPIAEPIKVNKKVREEIVKSVKENLLPPLPAPEKELLTIVVEKNKGQDIKKMTARQITSKILSSKSVDDYTVEIDSIEWNGIKYQLKQPLELNATFSGQRHKLVESQTKTEAEGSTSEEAVQKLKEKMVRAYNRLKGMIPEFMTSAEIETLNSYKGIILDESQ
jgi:hypothetical protein